MRWLNDGLMMIEAVKGFTVLWIAYNRGKQDDAVHAAAPPVTSRWVYKKKARRSFFRVESSLQAFISVILQASTRCFSPIPFSLRLKNQVRSRKASVRYTPMASEFAAGMKAGMVPISCDMCSMRQYVLPLRSASRVQLLKPKLKAGLRVLQRLARQDGPS